ncbi:MAG: SDR family NAD(P)-dependent oxidoreductase [Bacteroidales bacterium]
MNYFYVTGTSRGIGKAIAEELFKSKDNYVYGMSRHSTIEKNQYEHITIDFNDLEQTKNFQFKQHNDAEKIVLVNNAGMLGHVTQVGNLETDKIIQSYNINLISPAILTNKFIHTYKDNPAEKIIVNVSSGAARHTIQSWSTYCSTKAGLEMYARVIIDEQKENEDNPVKVFSIAPGIVDTEMQDEIREVEPENFPELDRFIQLKKEGNLEEPAIVARYFADVINNPDKFKDPLLDLRDL